MFYKLGRQTHLQRHELFLRVAQHSQMLHCHLNPHFPMVKVIFKSCSVTSQLMGRTLKGCCIPALLNNRISIPSPDACWFSESCFRLSTNRYRPPLPRWCYDSGNHDITFTGAKACEHNDWVFTRQEQYVRQKEMEDVWEYVCYDNVTVSLDRKSVV